MFIKYLVTDYSFSSGRAKFRKDFFEVRKQLAQEGLEFLEEEFDETPSQKKTVFFDVPETSRIGMWEDYVGKVRYLEITSDIKADFEKTYDAFSKGMKTIDHADILQTTSTAMKKNPLIFYKLAYSAPTKFEQRTFEAIVNGLESGDNKVIEVAAAAAGLLGWSEFSQPLDSVEKSLPPGSARVAVLNAIDVLID